MYLGISASTGQIGIPRLIKGRKLWDIRDLDMTFDALPHEMISATLYAHSCR
jgi:hypothetical protein